MRAKQWRQYVEPIAGDGWGFAHGALYKGSADGLSIHGLLAESTRSSDAIYLWQFRMPLVGPADRYVDLSWSHRIGYFEWIPPATGLERAVRDALAVASSELESWQIDYKGPNTLMVEAHAYAKVLSGDFDSARTLLREAVRGYDGSSGWQAEAQQRYESALAAMDSGDHAALIDTLLQWRAETIESLGLNVKPLREVYHE